MHASESSPGWNDLSAILPLPIPLEMDLETLLLRVRLALAHPDRDLVLQQTWLVEEILVRCQSTVDDPPTILDTIVPFLREAPDSAIRIIIQAFQRAVAPSLREPLLELLETLGADLLQLERDCVYQLEIGSDSERIEAMRLLTMLGPTTEESILLTLIAELTRLWPLEQARIEALLRQRTRAMPLIRSALLHADPMVRFRAEAVLQAMGSEALEAVPELLAMPGEKDPSPSLLALGPAAISALVAALESPCVRTRCRAMNLLGRWKSHDPGVLPALLASLDIRYPELYTEAVHAVLWRDADNSPTDLPDEVVPSYRIALEHPVAEVAVGAATALALGGHCDDPVPSILVDAVDRGTTEQRWAALLGLGACPTLPAAAFDLLRRHPAYLETLAEQLGRRSPASPPVLHLLAETYLTSNVPYRAIPAALARAGEAGGQAALEEMRRRILANAPIPVPRLLELFRQLDPSALGAVWRDLQESIDSSDSSLLHLHCAILSQGGGADEVIEILREHPEPACRAAAADALLLAPAEAAPSLLAALEDRDSLVRSFALRSLLAHWMAEPIDFDWRSRLIEATLRYVARVGCPEVSPQSPLAAGHRELQSGAMLEALEWVCESAPVEECRAACEILCFASGPYSTELTWHARKLQSVLFAILERFPILRNNLAAAGAALLGDVFRWLPPGLK